MKLNFFPKTSSGPGKGGHTTSARVLVSKKSITLNKAMLHRLEIDQKASLFLTNDEENPKDVYLAFFKRGDAKRIEASVNLKNSASSAKIAIPAYAKNYNLIPGTYDLLPPTKFEEHTFYKLFLIEAKEEDQEGGERS